MQLESSMHKSHYQWTSVTNSNWTYAFPTWGWIHYTMRHSVNYFDISRDVINLNFGWTSEAKDINSGSSRSVEFASHLTGWSLLYISHSLIPEAFRSACTALRKALGARLRFTLIGIRDCIARPISNTRKRIVSHVLWLAQWLYFSRTLLTVHGKRWIVATCTDTYT